ncbi:hypothetical protein BST81_01580 [Leptolyngbya sp. 'hensonii']|uniref:protein phosphatase 2C domain-containing protein n=1 Tax=Leptolyngbya sp. 'hensonii' TaxID=1922337 RepID=UPI00094FA275|nr:protein phosphatase 2C domain-containing protein [Leptolyngbya sp. 'hensonii']OLP20152.1 hypothetical protein BST81_01580 [Leptolyngbya sp. 'hensonii']
MKALFQIAAGSIAGRDHILTGKNNQDALYYTISEHAILAIVCDGCGSGAYSEVGARLGARLTAATIAQILQDTPDAHLQDEDFWDRVYRTLLLQFQALVQTMGGDRVQAIRDYFLFTIVGTVITPAGASIFSLGDGCLILNGQVTEIGPFPNNAPPYLAYGLLEQTLSFHVHAQIPLAELHTLLIGTDGVLDLTQVADSPVPGSTKPVGPICQFWEQEHYFTNPDRVRRTLALANREVTKPDWQNHQMVKTAGLLPDDTTLIVIRKQLP